MTTLRLLPELEEALRQIPGVKAASVVTGPDAVPTEVHVLASPGKPAKQVVRDVQSLSMARYDLDIDHRIVSVVQIGDEEAPLAHGVAAEDETAGGDSAHTRPAISAIMVRSGSDATEAAVTLRSGDLVFEGRAEGPAGSSHRARLVAEATLAAVSELLGRPCEVESAAIINAAERQVALCVLTISGPRDGELVLTGSALVKGDDADAVTKAVLAALNRQLTG